MVLNLSATKHVVLKCGLKSVCSFFCGLDFVCALSFLRSSNKNVVLTQRYPKTCGLKSANISVNKEVKPPPFAQHIFIDLAACHYNLTPQPLSLLLHTLSNLPQISPFFKNFLFSGRALANPLFSPGPKIPVFQRPRTRRILELQTCKQVFTIYRFRRFL